MSIFKYMSTKLYNGREEINLLEKVFEDKFLRFSSPLNFNDPFEFRCPIEYLNPSNSNDLNNLINNTFDKNQFHNTALDNELRNIGILCLSANNKNILMWSYYANNHKGIVLEFDKNHLFFTESNEDKKLIHGLKKVKYQRFKPKPKSIEEYIYQDIYLTKNLIWKKEQEYRMTILLDESDNVDKYNIKFPSELIKAVYLGVKTDNKDCQYIINLKQKKEWEHLNIYKFGMDENNYNLISYKLEL